MDSVCQRSNCYVLPATTSEFSSRSAGAGRYRGDLATGAGLDAALGGVDTVVHLATSRRKDIGHTRNLLEAAKRAGIAHLVFISIVGVDRIPYGYYRDKVASEQAIAQASIPFTILRATKFHSFVAAVFQLRLPVVLAPSVSLQTIATEEGRRRGWWSSTSGAPAGSGARHRRAGDPHGHANTRSGGTSAGGTPQAGLDHPHPRQDHRRLRGGPPHDRADGDEPAGVGQRADGRDGRPPGP